MGRPGVAILAAAKEAWLRTESGTQSDLASAPAGVQRGAGG